MFIAEFENCLSFAERLRTRWERRDHEETQLGCGWYGRTVQERMEQQDQQRYELFNTSNVPCVLESCTWQSIEVCGYRSLADPWEPFPCEQSTDGFRYAKQQTFAL